MMAAAFVVELAWAAAVRAQAPVGGVRGVVSDAEFGGAVPQAAVRLVELNREQTTGDDGHFLFGEVPPGVYTLTVSKPGYERRVEPSVTVAAGSLADLEMELKGEFTEMEELVVRDMELTDTASEAGLLNLRGTSLSFQDSVSREMMGRAGAGDAASALKLVVGATVSEGKYATVRGLGDRYVGAALNGIRIPSPDPRRRAVQLDTFPSGTIESMSVAKTFVPDLPGDYSGGGVNIRTISIPEKPFFKFSLSRELNASWTGKDGFVTYEGGGCPHWGRDLGGRDLPPELKGLVTDPDFIAGLSVPYSRHDQLVDATHPQDPTYALFDRVTHSVSPVMGVKFGKVPDGNYGYSLSAGNPWSLGGDWTAGWIGAFAYGQKFAAQAIEETTKKSIYQQGFDRDEEYRAQVGSQEIKNSMLFAAGLAEGDRQEFGFTWLRNQVASDRATYREEIAPPGDPQYTRSQSINYTERSLDARQLTWKRKWDWAEIDLFGAHNLVRQRDPDVRMFKELGTQSGDSWMYTIAGVDKGADLYNPARIWRDVEEDNSQYGLNFAIPFKWYDSDAKFKFGWLQDETRRTFEQAAFTYQTTLNQVRPIPAPPAGDPRWGWYTNDVRSQSFTTTNRADLWTDVFCDPDRIGAGPYVKEIRWYLTSSIGKNDVNYDGLQSMPAGYWMLDFPLTARLKAIAGARVEVTDMSVDPISLADVVNPTAPANYTVATVTDGRVFLDGTNRAGAQVSLQDAQWLRSMGLVYELGPRMNLRISWAQTIARPTFRELAPVLSVDPIEGEAFFGNGDLEISRLENDDVRWEWFRQPGEVWSVSWFYKHVADPIEKVSFGYYGETYTLPVNLVEGQVSGMEYEMRKKLDWLPVPIGSVSVGINYTEMKSTVIMDENSAAKLADYGLQPQPRSREDQFVSPIAFIHTPFLLNFFNLEGFDGLDGPARDMEGQPEFLFNFNLTYDIEQWGTALNYFHNIRGDMLKTGAAVGDGVAVPDVYTKELGTANLSLTQKLGDDLKLTLSAKNLLDAPVQEVYRIPDGTEYTRREYREGVWYSVGLSGSW